jgi:hypothetical protein
LYYRAINPDPGVFVEAEESVSSFSANFSFKVETGKQKGKKRFWSDVDASAVPAADVDSKREKVAGAGADTSLDSEAASATVGTADPGELVFVCSIALTSGPCMLQSEISKA